MKLQLPDGGEQSVAGRWVIEGELKLTLNTEKTHVTHVNDSFVFVGHRIIRKRGPRGL